jgi:hypothetical protein
VCERHPKHSTCWHAHALAYSPTRRRTSRTPSLTHKPVAASGVAAAAASGVAAAAASGVAAAAASGAAAVAASGAAAVSVSVVVVVVAASAFAAAAASAEEWAEKTAVRTNEMHAQWRTKTKQTKRRVARWARVCVSGRGENALGERSGRTNGCKHAARSSLCGYGRAPSQAGMSGLCGCVGVSAVCGGRCVGVSAVCVSRCGGRCVGCLVSRKHLQKTTRGEREVFVQRSACFSFCIA